MAARIGINGFGRIGRYLTRLIIKDPDLELVCVNARHGNEMYAHLFKHDTTFGTYPGEVSANDGGIEIDGRQVAVHRWPDPTRAKWGREDVDIVVEATGKFRTRKDCLDHLDNGARKVVVSAPAKGEGPDISLLYNVNHADYDPDAHHILDVASCTTNCLAPMVQVLDRAVGIKHGQATTIHSYTTSQNILDGSHKDLRRARAAAMSQIPTTTGSAKAVIKVLPEFQGRLDAVAVRVPTHDASITDLVCEVERPATVESVNRAFREAANETIGYSEQPLVSADYIGDSHGMVLDALSTNVVDETSVKIMAWYDNEAGFTHQLERVLRLVAGKLQ
jgi:glyceraldehyde 3-phosphate dehydrogenase